MTTWTFVGHWEDDRIVVEYVLPGDVQDPRIDSGYWAQGLWAASGTGSDMTTTQAAVIAEYENAPGTDQVTESERHDQDQHRPNTR